MKGKSKIWSRAVTLLAAGMLIGTKACAERPNWPRVLLDKGDDAVLAAPEAWFAREIGRIKMPPPQFTAKPAPDSYAQQVAEAELGDLRAALRKLKVPKDQLEQIVGRHAAERTKLTR